MIERMIDYVFVAFVILIVFGLFRLSRILMHRLICQIKKKYPLLTADRILMTGFFVLLAGLIFLPLITSILSVIDNNYLFGGMFLHLLLVALSIILFSISEDLFRIFSIYPSDKSWSRRKHFRNISIPLLIFWVTGCLFISPLFYSCLTIILALFYLYALICRPVNNDRDPDRAD